MNCCGLFLSVRRRAATGDALPPLLQQVEREIRPRAGPWAGFIRDPFSLSDDIIFPRTGRAAKEQLGASHDAG